MSLVLALRLGTSPWLLHFVLCLVWTIWHQWGSPRGVYPLPGLTGRVYILFQVWQEGGSWDFLHSNGRLLSRANGCVKCSFGRREAVREDGEILWKLPCWWLDESRTFLRPWAWLFLLGLWRKPPQSMKIVYFNPSHRPSNLEWLDSSHHLCFPHQS